MHTCVYIHTYVGYYMYTTSCIENFTAVWESKLKISGKGLQVTNV